MLYLKQVSLLSIVILICLQSCGTNEVPPDLIIYNGNIYTVDERSPWAQAISIRDGKIVALGDDTGILHTKGSSTEVIDAQGKFIMPGFIEGHGHFPGLGSSLQELNLFGSQDWDEIVEAVQSKVKNAKPGQWIIGRGWHQEKWSQLPAQNVLGYPYHFSVSSISASNPVLLVHSSGHALFANKAAMEAAGISIETPDPTGGHIVRGDGNAAIGIFEENAQGLIQDAYRQYLTTQSSEELEAKWLTGIELAQDECLKKGITSFQDAGSSLDEIEKLRGLAEAGKLRLRLWVMIRHTSEFLDGKLTGFPIVNAGKGYFTSRALKASIDGALGTYGAWLLAPYDDNPGITGHNTTSLDELKALADLADEHGLQLCIHAIGDRANREVLNIYEKRLTDIEAGTSARWRIEHAQHLDPEDIPRFGKLGVIASMQGIHCTSDAPFVVKRLGEDRSRKGAYVWKSLLNSGALVTNGTDAPVEDVNPLLNFYASVTRKRADDGMTFYPEQKLTREEALYSYTMANAYAAFEDHQKGSLAKGKFADLVILTDNLATCSDEAILDTRVLMTIVGGQIRYQAEGF